MKEGQGQTIGWGLCFELSFSALTFDGWAVWAIRMILSLWESVTLESVTLIPKGFLLEKVKEVTEMELAGPDLLGKRPLFHNSTSSVTPRAYGARSVTAAGR